MAEGRTNIEATMTPELWQRLKPLYEAALDLPKEQRAQYVSDVCKDDVCLKDELEKLLKSTTERTLPLDNPLIQFGKIFREGQRTLSDGQVLLNRFRIVRHLGSGGMGEVYEAEDLFLRGVHIALKTIHPDISGDPMMQKRLEREVLLAQEVTHPNLCPIHTIFHCDDPPPAYSFLTMKLLPGQTLAARLQESSQITNEDGLSILRQMSLGIGAIHAAGIVHRDIKTNNIMVVGSGPGLHLWITDFGLARAYETESTALTVGAVGGTPGYIAPELFLMDPPSQASDLFALGVVLHEVFAGEKPRPVPGTHSYTISPRLTAPKVPSLCVHLITECLQDAPQRRCTAFADALETFDSKLDRSHYIGRSGQFWTRRRFAATAAVGVCAVAGGTWWKWDELDNVLHPLPPKRFVALLNWPKTSDSRLTPMLTGALSAIKSELSRLEAFDRDLLVITPEDAGTELMQMDHLKDICDSLGANLVLAASVQPTPRYFKVLFRLLDPVSERLLRERTLETSIAAITSLPQKAVKAASDLLNLRHPFANNSVSNEPGTESAAAFSAFQAGEDLMKQPNDAGLNPAIDKYKLAVEQDVHFAKGYAKLALAYCRLATLRHDSGALELARGNSRLALGLDTNLVDGHMAMASVYEQSGDMPSALQEISRALAIDPSNPVTLVWQAQIYTRLNRWAEAEATYQRILNQRPNFWLAYNEWGVVLNDQGKYSEAIQKFQAASIAAPRNSLAFNNVGSIYLQTGHYPEAIDNFTKSLMLKPNALAASNISAALRTEGKPADALPFALKAVELDSADDNNWLELADCYASLPGKQRAAKEAYLKAAITAERRLQIDASDGASWMQLALYKAKSGAPQISLSLIKKAESLGAGDIDSQLCKARVLELLGYRDEALETLRACLLKGATDFQISSVSDLRTLARDPRYRKLLHTNPAT
ncbi:serine/threonine-protein kinase [Acidicapsa acidisoli]|uniref:serine/threonine-protein kinase n=1 Tax=Acidicapsa acidisoli TaxID=1615681 RepID=UPI0021E0D4D6|nr:serine/threonine-protein kinase [Acidicapsa acidisoli]